MEKRIEKLSLLEGKEIYYKKLVKDFPACEVKPWEKIEQFAKNGLYEMFGMWEKDTMLAYAFVAADISKKYLLMDYFAVSENSRGKGYGRYFLEHFWEVYPEASRVIFEVEDVAAAVNEQEKNIRERRIRFYEGAGLQRYPVYAKVYDAFYQLMFFQKSGKMPEIEEITEGYKDLYQMILGTEKMAAHMEISIKSTICDK